MSGHDELNRRGPAASILEKEVLSARMHEQAGSAFPSPPPSTSRTYDPEEADFFYVPVSSKLVVTLGGVSSAVEAEEDERSLG